MGTLRWFNKNKYTSLGDVLGAIKKELEALQPSDSSTVKWDKTSTGISASIIGSTGASADNTSDEETSVRSVPLAYDGYFTIKQLEQTEEDRKNDQIRAIVCDGKTWDDDTQTSSNSYARINGVVSGYAATPVVITQLNRYIVLRYSFANNTASIMTVPEVMTNFYLFTDYVIGEYVNEQGGWQLIQRHTDRSGGNGEIVLNTYVQACLMGDFPND